MEEQTRQRTDPPCECGQDEGINLLDCWRVIRKRLKMIGWIVSVTVFATAVISLFMTNIYQARAVIAPVTIKEGGGSGGGLTALAQQFGGLPGLSLSGATTASEVASLLKSNILREKITREYNLMPVLFYNRWDAERQTWKKGGLHLNPMYYVSWLNEAVGIPRPQSARQKDPDVPDMWDALRLLDKHVTIRQDIKQNTITLAVDAHDPDVAARIADDFLIALTNHMSIEAKRVAATNRKYLEEQLGSTTDPFIKQKTYNMIAQQIEAGMLAEVKENFAFKVIDPPMAPDRKIKPRRGLMVMVSFVAALLAAVFMAFFMEHIERIKARNREVDR